MPTPESQNHPHVPLELAPLFLSENGATLEEEYRSLISALILCLKPSFMLEVGCGDSTHLWARTLLTRSSSAPGILHCIEPSNSPYAPVLTRHQSNIHLFESLPTLLASSPPSYDLVLIDCSPLTSRIPTLLALHAHTLLHPHSIILLHDTSPYRRSPGDPSSPDPDTAPYLAALRALPFSRLTLPLSRGLTLIQPPAAPSRSLRTR